MCGETGLLRALPGLLGQAACGLQAGDTTVTWTVAPSGEAGSPHRRREVIGGLTGWRSRARPLPPPAERLFFRATRRTVHAWRADSRSPWARPVCSQQEKKCGSKGSEGRTDSGNSGPVNVDRSACWQLASGGHFALSRDCTLLDHRIELIPFRQHASIFSNFRHLHLAQNNLLAHATHANLRYDRIAAAGSLPLAHTCPLPCGPFPCSTATPAMALERQGKAAGPG